MHPGSRSFAASNRGACCTLIKPRAPEHLLVGPPGVQLHRREEAHRPLTHKHHATAASRRQWLHTNALLLRKLAAKPAHPHKIPAASIHRHARHRRHRRPVMLTANSHTSSTATKPNREKEVLMHSVNDNYTWRSFARAEILIL